MAGKGKRPYRPAPGVVPEELLATRATCPECGASVAIDWLTPTKYPAQPIAPRGGGGHYVPVGIQLTCVNSHSFSHRVPVHPTRSRVGLFGDEASRYIADHKVASTDGPLNFRCLTLVKIQREARADLVTKVKALKAEISPKRQPDTWFLHYRDIVESRPEHGRFNLQGSEEKIAFATRFAETINAARPSLAFFNISGCIRVPSKPKDRAAAIKALNQEIFSLALVSTLDQLRRQGITPNWTFDNIKDATLGDKIEGWAEEAFLGLQHTRLFTWLSAGSTVIAPTFVKPGSDVLLEVADFMSYWIAREFYRATQGLASEVPSKLFGLGSYIGVDGSGDVLLKGSVGLPLQKFWGLKPS